MCSPPCRYLLPSRTEEEAGADVGDEALGDAAGGGVNGRKKVAPGCRGSSVVSLEEIAAGRQASEGDFHRIIGLQCNGETAAVRDEINRRESHWIDNSVGGHEPITARNT